MKMRYLKNILKKEINKPILLVIVVGCAYIKLLDGFFQQDEWFSYSLYILHKNMTTIDSLKFFFAPSVGHYNPFTNLLQHSLFSLFGINYVNFAVVGIFLHLLVVVTLYYFVKMLFTKNNTVPFFVALTFGLFASIYQGVSWVVADISTLLATFLGIVSAMKYISFVKSKNYSHLLLSLVILFASLMFKEITIGLFILYFLFTVWINRKKPSLKPLFLIFDFGIIYLIMRVIMIFLPNITGDTLATSSQPVSNILYNLLTVPSKSIAQIVFPPNLIKYLISGLYKMFAVIPSDLTIDKIISFSSTLIGTFMFIYVFRFQLKVKNITHRSAIVFGLSWIIVNSFIFSISPESSGSLVVVDSRNLYFSSIGVAIIIVAMISALVKYDSKKTSLILISIAFLNLYLLANNLNKVIDMGRERKHILNQITKTYKILPKKTIFYISSNSSYYGLPDREKIPPFQSGFGQTLLVWYYQTENFPKDFYKNRFLWDIKSQDYLEFEGRGFGYFRNYENLKTAIVENKLKPESVIAFSWDANSNILTDMTSEIRNKLKNEIRYK